MKILYMNLLYNNSGQRRMDENIISELVKIAEVYVVCPEGWYKHIIEGANYIHYCPRTIIRNKRTINYINSIKNIGFANKLSKQGFDYYLFASYETILYSLWSIINPRILSKSYVIHNNNIDGINEKRVKKLFFNTYANKINHVVLEDFIGEYLKKEFNLKEESVFVLPHPLNSNICNEEKIYDCVGISNSNDDTWIREIIHLEKETNQFKNNGCKVVLRSSSYSFDDGYLSVINGWLSDNEYNKYINTARCIFLPFPNTFRYRMSGSVVDAFSNHTVVIGSGIPLFNYYATVYKNICKVVNSSKEFCKIIIEMKDNLTKEKDFDLFIQRHSQEQVLNSLKRMFISETIDSEVK